MLKRDSQSCKCWHSRDALKRRGGTDMLPVGGPGISRKLYVQAHVVSVIRWLKRKRLVNSGKQGGMSSGIKEPRMSESASNKVLNSFAVSIFTHPTKAPTSYRTDPSIYTAYHDQIGFAQLDHKLDSYSRAALRTSSAFSSSSSSSGGLPLGVGRNVKLVYPGKTSPQLESASSRQRV